MSSAICGDRNRLRRSMRSISASWSATRCSSVRFHWASSSDLRREALGLIVHGVVQLLDAQDRAHARDQGRLVDRLGQVFVGADVQTGDDVLGVGCAP